MNRIPGALLLTLLMVLAACTSADETADREETVVAEETVVPEVAEVEPAQIAGRIEPLVVFPAEPVIERLHLRSNDSPYWLIEDEPGREQLLDDVSSIDSAALLVGAVDLEENAIVTAITQGCQPAGFWLESTASLVTVVVKQSPTDCAQQEYWLPIFVLPADAAAPLLLGEVDLVVESESVEGEGESTDRFRFDALRNRSTFASTGLIRSETQADPLRLTPGSFVVARDSQTVATLESVFVDSRLAGAVDRAAALDAVPVVVAFTGCRVSNVWAEATEGELLVTVIEAGAPCAATDEYLAVLAIGRDEAAMIDGELRIDNQNRFDEVQASTSAEVDLETVVPSQRVPLLARIDAAPVFERLGLDGEAAIYWAASTPDQLSQFVDDLGPEQVASTVAEIDIDEQYVIAATTQACDPEGIWLEAGESDLVVVVLEGESDCEALTNYLLIFEVADALVQPTLGIDGRPRVFRTGFAPLRPRDTVHSTRALLTEDADRLDGLTSGRFAVARDASSIAGVKSLVAANERLADLVLAVEQSDMLPLVVAFDACSATGTWVDVRADEFVVTVASSGVECDEEVTIVAVIGLEPATAADVSMEITLENVAATGALRVDVLTEVTAS